MALARTCHRSHAQWQLDGQKPHRYLQTSIGSHSVASSYFIRSQLWFFLCRLGCHQLLIALKWDAWAPHHLHIHSGHRDGYNGDLWPQRCTDNTVTLLLIDQLRLGLGGTGPSVEIWLGFRDKETRRGHTGCLWGNRLSPETASLSTPAIDLLLMILRRSICMILSGDAAARQIHICMLPVSLLLLTQRQRIFTCLLTHLIGFTHCMHFGLGHSCWKQDSLLHS